MEYRIKPEYLSKYPVLVTTVPLPGGGVKSISLTGKSVIVDKPATVKGPGGTITIPAATPHEMELVHRAGHPFTEAVAATPEPAKGKL
jgi:hypothetical protein